MGGGRGRGRVVRSGRRGFGPPSPARLARSASPALPSAPALPRPTAARVPVGAHPRVHAPAGAPGSLGPRAQAASWTVIQSLFCRPRTARESPFSVWRPAVHDQLSAVWVIAVSCVLHSWVSGLVFILPGLLCPLSSPGRGLTRADAGPTSRGCLRRRELSVAGGSPYVGCCGRSVCSHAHLPAWLPTCLYLCPFPLFEVSF